MGNCGNRLRNRLREDDAFSISYDGADGQRVGLAANEVGIAECAVCAGKGIKNVQAQYCITVGDEYTFAYFCRKCYADHIKQANDEATQRRQREQSIE